MAVAPTCLPSRRDQPTAQLVTDSCGSQLPPGVTLQQPLYEPLARPQLMLPCSCQADLVPGLGRNAALLPDGAALLPGRPSAWHGTAQPTTRHELAFTRIAVAPRSAGCLSASTSISPQLQPQVWERDLLPRFPLSVCCTPQRPECRPPGCQLSRQAHQL